MSTHDAWNWGISGKTEDDYVTLTMARTNDATDLNPVIAMESGSYSAINPVFSTLISAEMSEGSLVFVPELATSWEASQDGLTWTRIPVNGDRTTIAGDGAAEVLPAASGVVLELCTGQAAVHQLVHR